MRKINKATVALAGATVAKIAKQNLIEIITNYSHANNKKTLDFLFMTALPRSNRRAYQ